ncbi:MAG: isochorismate synthase [Balneolaceae bacterium]
MKSSLISNESNSRVEDLQIDLPSLARFIRDHSGKKWLSLAFPVPAIDPLAYIEQKTDPDDLYYWEQPDRSFAIVAGGSSTVLKSTGKNRFTDIGQQSRTLSKQIASFSSQDPLSQDPFLLGGYSFSDHNIDQEWKEFGAARFVLPEWCIVKKSGLHYLKLVLPLQGVHPEEIIEQIQERYAHFIGIREKIRNFKFSPPPRENKAVRKFHIKENFISEWYTQVDKARKMINSGDFQKIVIARQLEFHTEQTIHVTRALHHLREHFPGCTVFMVRAGNGPIFLGATPDRLIALHRNRILTEGLAGSISRGESASEDAALEHFLMKSPKDREEHEIVVQDIHKNLTSYSSGVEYPDKPEIKKLSNVQHLYTPITARVNSSTTIHDLAGHLHPTPAVGGYPRHRAIPHINEIESINRGWYAGPIGWYNLRGSGEFAVAIRSALINNKEGRLFAGCGIVADSDPDKEWTETELKLKPVLNALKRAIR